ncbi:hypothetical protein I656_03348 [Geobacillus sp. WSUCF1]|nr:hypothetical protein I656_03348 [Geobacillus sp. WSUCF1]
MEMSALFSPHVSACPHHLLFGITIGFFLEFR